MHAIKHVRPYEVCVGVCVRVCVRVCVVPRTDFDREAGVRHLRLEQLLHTEETSRTGHQEFQNRQEAVDAVREALGEPHSRLVLKEEWWVR